jgi:predicted nucleic acid-binding protein
VTDGWLLDNSAWARLDADGLDEDRREEVAGLLLTGRLHTCLSFLLEAGVSARDPDDWAALAEDLAGLPEAPIDAVVERRAREAQHDLVRAGLHRAIPIVDLLLAAIAERHDLTLLHYDRDFDRLRESTTLRFRSDWLAAAGTL